MQRFLLLLLVWLLVPAVCRAQRVLLEDFETGTGTWNRVGLSMYSHNTTDDQRGDPPGCMDITDSGDGAGIYRTFTGVIPSYGDYKIAFYYKNGITSNPQANLGVMMDGVAVVYLSGDAPTPVTTWTYGETPIVYGISPVDPLTVAVRGDNANTVEQDCRFDEFYLVRHDPIPTIYRLTPPDGYYVAGNQPLQVWVQGGSGNYTSCAFDIDKDGSAEFTDTDYADGFSFAWDTTAHADGVAPVRITVTDDAADTGIMDATYTVANAGGRVAWLQNGDFESWTGGLPDGWTKVDLRDTGVASPTPGNSTVSREVSRVFTGDASLKIHFAAADSTYRYTLMSNAFPGDRTDYIVSGGFRGGDARVAYFESPDGVAWSSTYHVYNPFAGSLLWKEGCDAPWSPAAPVAWLSLCTHKFNAGGSFWDSLSVTSSDVLTVGEWYMY